MRLSNSAFKARLRGNPTDAEAIMWESLKGRGLAGYKFTRQMTIGKFTVDFVCRRRKLVVEVDGPEHENSATDGPRTHWLNQQGYSVIRFTNQEVILEKSEVLNSIVNVLEGMPDPMNGLGNYSAALPPLRLKE